MSTTDPEGRTRAGSRLKERLTESPVKKISARRASGAATGKNALRPTAAPKGGPDWTKSGINSRGRGGAYRRGGRGRGTSGKLGGGRKKLGGGGNVEAEEAGEEATGVVAEVCGAAGALVETEGSEGKGADGGGTEGGGERRESETGDAAAEEADTSPGCTGAGADAGKTAEHKLGGEVAGGGREGLETSVGVPETARHGVLNTDETLAAPEGAPEVGVPTSERPESVAAAEVEAEGGLAAERSAATEDAAAAPTIEPDAGATAAPAAGFEPGPVSIQDDGHGLSSGPAQAEAVAQPLPIPADLLQPSIGPVPVHYPTVPSDISSGETQPLQPNLGDVLRARPAAPLSPAVPVPSLSLCRLGKEELEEEERSRSVPHQLQPTNFPPIPPELCVPEVCGRGCCPGSGIAVGEVIILGKRAWEHETLDPAEAVSKLLSARLLGPDHIEPPVLPTFHGPHAMSTWHSHGSGRHPPVVMALAQANFNSQMVAAGDAASRALRTAVAQALQSAAQQFVLTPAGGFSAPSANGPAPHSTSTPSVPGG